MRDLSPTGSSGNKTVAGLPDSKLHEIHDGAVKSAKVPTEPTRLTESLRRITGTLTACKPRPPVAAVKVDPVVECLGWGFSKRCFSERAVIDRGGKWGAKLAMLKGKLGTGFTVALIGERWTGKTMMACELAAALVLSQSGGTALYVRVIEFFNAIKGCYGQGSSGVSKEIDRFCRPSLLVLDAFNVRGDTSWEDQQLALLMDKRYANMDDTLVISNHKDDAFEKSFGDDAYRRLTQTGGVIEADWGSFRDSDRRLQRTESPE